LAYALTTMDMPSPALVDMEKYIGPPLGSIFADLGVAPDKVPRAIDLYRERFSSIGLFENRVYPGVVEMLDRLNRYGLELHVATSKPTKYAVRILEHFALTTSFEEIVGATLDGSRSHKADVIAHAIRNTGACETVMIGDRKHDVKGAAAHGIPAIAVTWGFGSLEELGAEDPWRTATNTAELTDILLADTY